MTYLTCTVDISRILYNLSFYTKPALLMVKANAYGLGEGLIRHLDAHVAGYGVATVAEGARVRALSQKPILLVAPWGESQGIVDHALTPLVGSEQQLRSLVALRQPIVAHLKVDSGMHRFGVENAEGVLRLVDLAGGSQVCFRGIGTHFASTATAEVQRKRFGACVSIAEQRLGRLLRHAEATSTGLDAHYDMLRIGMGAYQHAVRLCSRVLAVRRLRGGDCAGYDGVFVAPCDGVLAVVAGGYADGIDRRLVGHRVRIGSRLCPIVAVCMDVCMVWCGEPVAVDTAVEILGDVAMPATLSPYEIYTSLRCRCKICYRPLGGI